MFICQEKNADTESCVKIFPWQMGIDTSQMNQLFLNDSAAWVLPKGLKCAVYDIKNNSRHQKAGFGSMSNACGLGMPGLCEHAKVWKKCAEAHEGHQPSSGDMA